MISRRARLIRRVVPYFAASSQPDIVAARRAFDRLGRAPMARRVKAEEAEFGGVRGKRFVAPTPGPEILYIHGGGYVIGSPRSHAPTVSWIVRRTGGSMAFPDYRLAPENRYPAALEDAVSAYREFMGSSINSNRVVMGDSAGGGLAVSMLARARDEGLAMPKSLVLLSPWTDLSMSGLSVKTRAGADPILTPDLIETAAEAYAGETDRRDPGLSPLFAGLEGLPRTLIQVGSAEILYDDSIRLSENLQGAGVEVTLDVAEGMWHVYPLFTPFLPEARRAIAQIAEFVAN